MASEVEICNRALSGIGAKRINALTDASREAQECDLHFAFERDVLLSGFDWVFARGHHALAEMSVNDLEDQWAYKYAVPTDMLNIVWVNDISAARAAQASAQVRSCDYAIVGEFLYSDVEACYMGYTKTITDTSLFSTSFENALIWRLSAAIAMPITQSTRIADRAEQMAERVLSSAMATDAALEIHEPLDIPAHIKSRS